MRQRAIQTRPVKSWAAMLLLVVAGVALPSSVLAQDEQDGPRQGGVAFAGGQMVRGIVTATSADHLTVKTEAGEVYQVALSANTRLSKDRQPVKMADIKVGDAVGAMGVLDAPAKTVHAVFVGVIDAEQMKKARENMGKTYITGKVTAIDMDALKLTVMRPDGVSQVIGVDEQTSFKRGGRGMAAIASGAGVIEMGGGGGAGRGMGAGPSGTGAAAGNGSGGESITFADMKVGDTVAGRGALKNGMFVPTELGVMDPAAMGQRRRRGADGAGPGASPAGTGVPPDAAAPKGSAAQANPAIPAGVPQ
ncbi:MAG TPA: hypothetical protein VHU44_01270 [Acidobacteriaceae bacterium]|nr:hypothetical protein [Acidobacteriaceae bacterium]